MIRSRNLTRVLFAACGFLFSGILAQASPPPHRDRAAFVQKLASLPDEASEGQVLAALGKPDDVITPFELNDASPHYDHVWAYGTDGHLTFPTLGCVYMQKHRVLTTSRRLGKQPPPGMFTESELRGLFKLIDRSRIRYSPDGRPTNPTSMGDSFGYDECTPRTIITIVNTLLPLGKTRILAALDAYCEVVENQNVFLILRALFDVPKNPGYMPRMMVGGPSPPEPDNRKAVPRFPLLIVDDVPLTVVSGYWLAGFAEPPASEIDYFRAHGTLRRHPLEPKGNPLAIPGIVAAMPVWSEPQRDYHHKSRPAAELQQDSLLRMKVVMGQVLAMLGSQTRLTDWDESTEASLFKRWNEVTADLAQKNLRWNAKAQRYMTSSGDYLPEPAYVRYQMVQWKPPLPGRNPSITLMRTDGRHVNIQASWTAMRNAPSFIINIYGPDRKLLAAFQSTTKEDAEMGNAGGLLTASTVEAKSRTKIFVEVVQAKTVRKSPVFVP